MSAYSYDRRTATGDVAKTILEQMGGVSRLHAMIGAKNFIDRGKGLGFQWPARKRSKGNTIRITLRDDDTYDMEFANASVRGYKVVKTYNGVYGDQLREVFQRQTGLRLSL